MILDAFDPFELRNIIMECTKIGSQQTLIEAGLTSQFLTQRKAYELYGEGRVKRWVAEGLVHRRKDGDNNSTVRYDKLELSAVSLKSNITSYQINKSKTLTDDLTNQHQRATTTKRR